MNIGRAAVLDRPHGTFRVEEAVVPMLDPNSREVLVKQELCGICGTDVHIYQGYGGLEERFPIVLGHEAVGTIEAKGREASKDFMGEPLQEGDRIYVVPALVCGACLYCQVHLEPSLCPNRIAYGLRPSLDQSPHFQGGFAQYILLNHPRTTFLKTRLPAQTAVLMEPLAVAAHMVERARLNLGDTVVVLGVGAIGLMALAAAQESGAGKVMALGAPASRIALAREFGAALAIDIEKVADSRERIEMVRRATPGGLGADVVMECAGTAAAVVEGLEMVRRGGTYVSAGTFTQDQRVLLDPDRLFTRKQVNLVGVWGTALRHFVRSRSLLERASYPFHKVVSHQLPLERLGDAIKALSTSYRLDGEEVRKVAIRAWS